MEYIALKLRNSLYKMRANASDAIRYGIQIADAHQRMRITSHYDLPFRFDNNQLLLSLTESTSSVWMRQLREPE